MKQGVLKETTLSAMVRDERMNSAGGIGLWAHSHMPYVERAVVVDTGSVDGTLEELEGLKKEYPHLEVYRHKWEGFVDTRNYCLEKVKTKRALVLDADELLTPKDFQKLAEFIGKNNRIRSFGFSFVQLLPNLDHYTTSIEEVMTARLFNIKGVNYQLQPTGYSEDVCFKDQRTGLWAPVKIKHFLPTAESRDKKKKDWYQNGNWRTQTPLENARINGWKMLSPWRLRYPIPKKLDIDKYLKERGIDTTQILPIGLVEELP